MKTCKHKNRLQIYLDGWMDESEGARLEKHLKKCPICQAELIELEVVSAAALEIVDEAPERSYWDSFFPRVQNRISSRSITPYESQGQPRKVLRLKIGSYTLAIASLAAVLFLTINLLPGILGRNDTGISPISGQTETAPAADIGGEDLPEGPSLKNESETISVQAMKPAIEDIRESLPGDAFVGYDEVPDELESMVLDEAGIAAYFRGRVVSDPAGPVLTVPVLPSAPPKTEFDKINEDYRLSSSMITAGILSEVSDRSDNSGVLNGQLDYPNSESGSRIAAGSWGYLSMPPDSGNTGEIRRYFIELELIQTK